MSLRAAINAMCRSCIYDQYSAGNWRQQVTECTAHACPLYPHRPTTKPQTPEQQAKAQARKALKT